MVNLVSVRWCWSHRSCLWGAPAPLPHCKFKVGEINGGMSTELPSHFLLINYGKRRALSQWLQGDPWSQVGRRLLTSITWAQSVAGEKKISCNVREISHFIWVPAALLFCLPFFFLLEFYDDCVSVDIAKLDSLTLGLEAKLAKVSWPYSGEWGY